jgi:hypothetical protein
LESAQAKDIGEKVAESEFAQETVERIKTVTRRRRLTAPPVEADDQTTDPNVIAEYLDNVLPPGEVTELEQACLDNDMKLAEVAACHQILTLVLGEPAKVPPTARRRMYRLVKGPEAIPYRQPAAAGTLVAGVAAPAEVDEFHDRDEDDLLESFLGARGLLWLLSLLVVIGVLVIAVYLAIPPAPPPATQGYVAVAVPPPTTEPKPKPAPETQPDVVVDKNEKKELEPPAPPEPKGTPEPGPMPRAVGEGGPPTANAPDAERRVVAVYDTPAQPLLTLKRETFRWEKVDQAEPRVNSTDAILALPGLRPEIRLETGPRLQLWGNVPDLLPVGVADSRVTLFVPPQGLDADFLLNTGRVFISAPKAPRAVTVRVRFLEEAWDITLNTPDTEVGIDLIGEPALAPLFKRDVPEAPRFLAYLGVIEGSASVRSGFQTSGELRPGAKWKWDSKAGKAGPAAKDDPDDTGVPNRWTKAVPNTPHAKDVAAQVAEMTRRVTMSAGPFDVDFDAVVKDSREAANRRALAAWMLAGVDGVSFLIDDLEVDNAVVRDAVARALQHWCAADPGREALFVRVLGDKAAFNDTQRAFLLALVRGPERPVTEETVTKLFELLRDSKPAVRELARMQLARLDPVGAKESAYDTLSDRRAFQAQAWERALRKRMKAKE